MNKSKVARACGELSRHWIIVFDFETVDTVSVREIFPRPYLSKGLYSCIDEENQICKHEEKDYYAFPDPYPSLPIQNRVEETIAWLKKRI